MMLIVESCALLEERERDGHHRLRITGYATVMMMSSGVDCELINWHVLLPLAVQQMRPEALCFWVVHRSVRTYVRK